MGYEEGAVRSLVVDDVEWIVDLAGRCAVERESFAPRFWRRAPDARRLHARYLRSLIEDPAVSAMRTDHMFAFGMHRPGLMLVDDAAVDRVDAWTIEGPALLTRLAGESPVRFVCPVPEPDRAELAVRLGLACSETWWHRDLTERSTSSRRGGGSLQVRGARGRLVPAPPVYAPGGPVLLVTEFQDGRALAELERQAVTFGAAVSVVTQAPANDHREELLVVFGYRRTCDFYEGILEANDQRW